MAWHYLFTVTTARQLDAVSCLDGTLEPAAYIVSQPSTEARQLASFVGSKYGQMLHRITS